eukprot:snap_masked-scaffold_4-processed-gene-5.24-mRNA-1 protein AED:1.00 eAED:1.00 QI:0/0/0/0/1/1/2/0/67
MKKVRRNILLLISAHGYTGRVPNKVFFSKSDIFIKRILEQYLVFFNYGQHNTIGWKKAIELVINQDI